jgi:hypothetical protein
MVLSALMDHPEKHFKGTPILTHTFSNSLPAASDLAKPPELKEARVHKCFLALANRKIISKDLTSVSPDPTKSIAYMIYVYRACMYGKDSKY